MRIILYNCVRVTSMFYFTLRGDYFMFIRGLTLIKLGKLPLVSDQMVSDF